jgi:hypothetical protein
MRNEKQVGFKTRDQLMKSPTYQLYDELKQEIIKDYPPQKDRTREEHLEYIHRVYTLMMEPNGIFQDFVWENMSEQNQINQTRRAEGKKQGGRKPYTRKSDAGMDG